MKPQGPAEEPPTGFLSLVNALQTLFVQSGVVLAGPERPKPMREFLPQVARLSAKWPARLGRARASRVHPTVDNKVGLRPWWRLGGLLNYYARAA